MPNKIDKKIEGYVTYKVGDYLADNGWEIISCNPPGSHGGICLLDQDRSKGGVIPDIIAKKGNYILIIESKPNFASGVTSDIFKLEEINDNHIANLAERLDLDNNWLGKWKDYVQRGIAVKQIDKIEIKYIPESFIIFMANEKNEKVDVIIGSLANIKKLV
jgi:hypothetical protein